MSEPSTWDVVVIGAGAAGMLAAARAAQRGASTLLLEKNRKLGVKILISGGTRCNITHAADVLGIAAAFPKRQRQFLRSALAALPPHDLLELFRQEGVLTKVEETGKVFPISDRAIDVRDALVRMLQASGCQVRAAAAVLGIQSAPEQFQIDLADGPIFGRQIIIACGGQSYPGCGTTGDGYQWARQFGHQIVPPVPALAPLRSPDKWLQQLSGMTLPEVRLTVVDRRLADDPAVKPRQAILDEQLGSLLFTHIGLSGPVAMDLSRVIARAGDCRDLMLIANFLPHQNYESCLERLRAEIRQDGKRQIGAVLSEYVPRRLAQALLEQCLVDPLRKLAELSKTHQSQLAARLTRCPIDVSGTSGFEKAEVTSGGVSLNEVHSKTMESKRVPRCYFVGEVLDIDGPIGGYNFQAAFSTGWLAGSSIVTSEQPNDLQG